MPTLRSKVFSSQSEQHPHGRFKMFPGCLTKLLAGRRTNANHHERRRWRAFFLRRFFIVSIFFSSYLSLYYQLDEIERKHDIGQNGENLIQSTALRRTGGDPSTDTMRNEGNNSKNNKNERRTNLADFLTNANVGDASASNNLDQASLQEAQKGREHILSILEDAGIEVTDSRDVLRLPLWSSISDLYYNIDNFGGNSGTRADKTSVGPIILGLEGCASFRERVPPEERFLGVAGNFNSGTTAFGIALQKNCRMEGHSSNQNFVMRKRRSVFATNVNGMLSMVPWAKHKTAQYRHNNTINPPISIDHDKVLPLVVVRDPFFWMQSMCKEGYGVRWDHDSKHHCPNLIPNDFDKKRFPKTANNKDPSVPVWMGANPTVGPSWPSLIHYWNAWYESYYINFDAQIKSKDTSWPRLMIRFEDTLYYPKKVMQEVCRCGGGKLLFDEKQHQQYNYNLEEAKPDHKHQQKNNFVTAMIEYGTNATRVRNMTEMDIAFAVQNLNPTLMRAFGYSYPNTKGKIS